MELIIPILFSIGAIVLLLLGMAFKYMFGAEELFLISLILSTIFFFVGGVCWLGVTYVDPVTGTVMSTDSYNILTWIFVTFGFIPILLMFEHSFMEADEN